MMLRAVAIDDEIKALERFERIIEQEENIKLVARFLSFAPKKSL